MCERPSLECVLPEATEIVESFVAGLQAGLDTDNADTLNRQFAADIMWGSPYGAIVERYSRLHPIHQRFSENRPLDQPSRYEIRRVRAVADDVIVAQVARLGLDPAGAPIPVDDVEGSAFSEMAMYVLVRRDGAWWLAAGQNTLMRPGGARPAG